ncbi:hypothetical protein AAF712_006048 [Marasmius tenuissimus]|uniref:Uncharacterized protein n=1 Tax=Marasmius tenuissimus TaxID=585030 RepID=A0ABR2ZZN8_9AGAR
MSSQFTPGPPCSICSCRGYIPNPDTSPDLQQCWCTHQHKAHPELPAVTSPNPPPRGGIPGFCSVWVDPSTTFNPGSLCGSCSRPWFTHEPIDNGSVASGSRTDASSSPVTSVWNGPARTRNMANDGRNEAIARHSAATTSALSSFPVSTTQVNRIRDGSVTSRQASLGLNGRMASILARQNMSAGTTTTNTASSIRLHTGLQAPTTLPDGRWSQQYFVILLPHSPPKVPTLFNESDREHFLNPADRPSIRVSSECIGDIIQQAETWKLGGRITLTASSDDRVDNQLYAFLAQMCNDNGFRFSSSSFTFPLPLQLTPFMNNPFILLKAGRKPRNGGLTPLVSSGVAPYDYKIPFLEKLANCKHVVNPHERTGVLIFGPRYRLEGPLVPNGPTHQCFSYRFHLACQDSVQPAISDDVVREFREHSCDACSDNTLPVHQPASDPGPHSQPVPPPVSPPVQPIVVPILNSPQRQSARLARESPPRSEASSASPTPPLPPVPLPLPSTISATSSSLASAAPSIVTPALPAPTLSSAPSSARVVSHANLPTASVMAEMM